MLGIFLMAMDGTIVASTYAAIGSEFHRLENTSWIATGYLLTQTSFQYVCSALMIASTHRTFALQDPCAERSTRSPPPSDNRA